MKKKFDNTTLINSEEKYKAIFENSLDAILLTGADGAIYSANEAACKMFELSEKELCIRGRAGVVDITDPRLKIALKERKKSGKFFGELTLLRKNQEKFQAEVSTSTFTDAEGQQLTSMIIRDITELKKTEYKLKEFSAKMQEFARHLEETRENERSRIALNLHDDLGQRLMALNLDLAWIKSRVGVQSEAVRQKLEEMHEMINDTADSIKEISSFLRPAILYELGLIPAFNWQLKKFSRQSGIICRFICDPKDCIIDMHISLILFRILQESLTNIHRHAKASVVRVSLKQGIDKISLIIKDNGIGIDESKINSSTSYGIAGIRERVNSVNGNLYVKGIKGEGTVIRLTLPL
jgi:PAS domain S-box-containing protein